MVERRASQRPRHQAVRAALRDAARLATMVEPEVVSDYRGEERVEYLRILAEYVADLEVEVETRDGQTVAGFGSREIVVRLPK